MPSLIKDRTPRDGVALEPDLAPAVEPVGGCTACPPQPDRGDAAHDTGPTLLCW